MTRTEKLRREIKLVLKQIPRDIYKYMNNPNASPSYDDYINQVLQACKEAGLKFVPDEWRLGNLCYASQRDEGVRDATLSAIKSQVEEIENG